MRLPLGSPFSQLVLINPGSWSLGWQSHLAEAHAASDGHRDALALAIVW
jgi:hypothetical protein